jgi:uncharacterized protein (TIGR03118 family)
MCVAALGAALGFFPTPGAAQKYVQTNLVSDLPNINGEPVTNPNVANFFNPWGLTRGASTPWWVSENNSGLTSLLDGNGNPFNIFTQPDGTPVNFAFVPTTPSAPAGTVSNPTGVVFNGSGTDFVMPTGTPAGQPAIFIFVGEDGIISGWNPGVDNIAGEKGRSMQVNLILDNSDKSSPNGAVYKGATSALLNGKHYLYVTNFRSAQVEVYDTTFTRVKLSDDAFKPSGDGEGDDFNNDGEHIPKGFAPFNIQNIGGNLFVTYAKQTADRHDDVGGAGNGFVEIYTPAGKRVAHLEHGPWMNSPWGVVWTPRDFGHFSNSILVGNFRSGWIAAFNGFTHKFEGFLEKPDGSRLTIDHLWSLAFGNDGPAGPATTLYFTAGTNDEADGLFGNLVPAKGESDGSIE